MEISAPIQRVSESEKPQHLSPEKMTQLASRVVLAGTLLTGAAALAACDGTETGGQTQINSGSSGAGGSTPDNSGSSGSGTPDTGLASDGFTITNIDAFCSNKGGPNATTSIQLDGVVPFYILSSVLNEGGYDKYFGLKPEDMGSRAGVIVAFATEGEQVWNEGGGAMGRFITSPETVKFWEGVATGNNNFDPLANPVPGAYRAATAAVCINYGCNNDPLGNTAQPSDFVKINGQTPAEPMFTVVQVPPCNEFDNVPLAKVIGKIKPKGPFHLPELGKDSGLFTRNMKKENARPE